MCLSAGAGKTLDLKRDTRVDEVDRNRRERFCVEVAITGWADGIGNGQYEGQERE